MAAAGAQPGAEQSVAERALKVAPLAHRDWPASAGPPSSLSPQRCEQPNIGRDGVTQQEFEEAERFGLSTSRRRVAVRIGGVEHTIAEKDDMGWHPHRCYGLSRGRVLLHQWLRQRPGPSFR